MHLIDNIKFKFKFKFKFGIIWSDSAHASAADVPGKPGTPTARLYIAGSIHMKSFITKQVKPISIPPPPPPPPSFSLHFDNPTG